ncbi:MAG: DsbA family protein [Patescibacteria group bacterium]|nr:DsbA family protein [Patescibacteria group bacterium]
MKNNSINPLYSTPSAILVGSLIVAITILIHGGIIKIGPKTTTQAQVTQQASPQPAQPTPPPAASLDQVKSVFNKSAIKFGDTNSKLVIIEVADPSCPYCHIAAGKNPELNKQAGQRFSLVADGGTYVPPVPEIKKLVEAGKASFAYIYTPGHGNGEMGTKAMYCAFEKGRFWEVHDLLMGSSGYDLLNNKVKNDKTKSQELADFLQPVFDPGTMKQCLDSGKYDNKLKEDISLASSIGINGTPGFYLNANQFAGAYSYTDMESAVKSALGK